MAADWISIKNEYINTNISYRKLAEKHGVSFNTLKQRGHKENWTALRKKQYHKITTETTQKTADKIISYEVDRISKLIGLSDKVMQKIDEAIDQLETISVNGELIDTGLIDTHNLRQITQALKDVRDIIRTGEGYTDMQQLDKVLSLIGGNI